MKIEDCFQLGYIMKPHGIHGALTVFIDSDNPEQRQNSSEIEHEIRHAIEQLPRQQKRCFCLFYIQNRSYKEIAELTGYPYNEVRSYIQNSRRKVRLSLKQIMQ